MKKVKVILVAIPAALLIFMIFSLLYVQMIVPQVLLGWMDFIERNAHEMRFRWEVIWSVLLYSAILIVGGHFFARWICRNVSGRIWKWSWSLRGFVVFLLMFIVGTSAVAVVEQTSWLAKSPRSMFVRQDCPAHLRHIGQCLLLYAIDHQGKYPDDLAELLVAYPDFDPQMLCCWATQDQPATGSSPQEVAANARHKGHCSYIYFGKGRADPIADDDVLVCEHPGNHGGGMNALFGDGHCEWIREGDAQELFKRLTTTRPSQ
jgi:prepilin-type processing-associated H-X9-DG protein